MKYFWSVGFNEFTRNHRSFSLSLSLFRSLSSSLVHYPSAHLNDTPLENIFEFIKIKNDDRICISKILNRWLWSDAAAGLSSKWGIYGDDKNAASLNVGPSSDSMEILKWARIKQT